MVGKDGGGFEKVAGEIEGYMKTVIEQGGEKMVAIVQHVIN